MIKGFILKVLSVAYAMIHQHRIDLLRKKFNVPASVSINDISLEGHIIIDEFTYLNDYTRVDSGDHSKIKIGKHCAIGRFVHITSKTHDLIQPTTDELNSTIRLREADVIIGNYVWIGDKVTILPGVEVGDYAVIAAHAVVTKNVKPFEVVGGVPARHIRFNESHYRFSSLSNS